MKLKMKQILVPETVIEIDNFEINLSETLRLIDYIEEGGVAFDKHEERLKNVLINSSVIIKDSYTNNTYIKGDNYVKFIEKFEELYNNMDVKQLSRVRKLKELIK